MTSYSLFHCVCKRLQCCMHMSSMVAYIASPMVFSATGSCRNNPLIKPLNNLSGIFLRLLNNYPKNPFRVRPEFGRIIFRKNTIIFPEISLKIPPEISGNLPTYIPSQGPLYCIEGLRLWRALSIVVI